MFSFPSVGDVGDSSRRHVVDGLVIKTAYPK